jgi:hypothetical protein
VIQIGTYGSNVADQINQWLKRNPGWKVAQVHGIEVARTGGSDRNVLVVFESVDESSAPPR